VKQERHGRWRRVKGVRRLKEEEVGCRTSDEGEKRGGERRGGGEGVEEKQTVGKGEVKGERRKTESGRRKADVVGSGAM
jgi:hypothetical protein